MRSNEDIELIGDELRQFFKSIVVDRKPGTSWSFKILKEKDKLPNFKATLGYCSESSSGRTGRVVLDYNHVRTAPYDDIIDTFLHECAHALAGVHNKHNSVWRHWAKFLGANPKAKPKAKIANSTDEIRKNKWLIVLKDKGFLKPITSCSKRLKGLESRFYKDIPESKGNLWMIDWDHYHSLEEDQERMQSLVR